jgi:PIN domain nuclease of toxin-antitoxin system
VRLLLDTHVFLWWITDDPRLGASTRTLIADPGNALWWSVASSWEVATKAALGRLALAAPAEVLLPAQRALHGVSLLSVEERHVLVSAGLPRHHADPFDRLLVAQALCEGLTLVSYDAMVEGYDVPWVR